MENAPSCHPGISPVLCRALIYCVSTAVILFLIGLSLLLIVSGGGEIDSLVSIGQIIDSIADLSPEGVIGLGIIVVVVTPLVRLLATTILAARNEDRAIALLTVLSIGTIVFGFIIKTMA